MNRSSTHYKSQEYYRHLSSSNLPLSVVKETIQEILRIAAEELKKPLSQLTVLDIGSAWGDYSFELEKHVKKVVGVEPDPHTYKAASKNKVKIRSNVVFHNMLVEDYISKKKFDLIISLTTVEHMPQADISFAKAVKLLKKDGMIYITAPNKLWPFEPHYRLYFLNWLPLPIANKYLQLTGRGSSFECSSYAKTYIGMKKLLDKLNIDYRFILPKSTNAHYLSCGFNNGPYKLMHSFGITLIKKFPWLWFISKGFIVIGKKNKNL